MPNTTSLGSDVLAAALLATISSGTNFDIPPLDFSGSGFDIPDSSALTTQVTPLTNADLTVGLNGSGTFDVIMKSMSAHLKDEYDKNRITGAEYTKAYIAMASAALGGAVQFLLGRDQAAWQAINAQVAAITARVNLQTAKVGAAATQYQALTAKASYGLTALKMSTEDAQFGTLRYQLDNIQPVQRTLIQEQVETQRAQTLDIRTDGATVSGAVGKQKSLYAQQIDSYKRDSEYKIGKLYTDAWITQKTIDEGTSAPEAFAITELSELLVQLRVNNNLGS